MVKGKAAIVLNCDGKDNEAPWYAVKFLDGGQSLFPQRLLTHNVQNGAGMDRPRKPPRPHSQQSHVRAYEEQEQGDEEFFGPVINNMAQMQIPAHGLEHDRDTPPPEMNVEPPHLSDMKLNGRPKPPQWGNNDDVGFGNMY